MNTYLEVMFEVYDTLVLVSLLTIPVAGLTVSGSGRHCNRMLSLGAAHVVFCFD